MPFGVPGFRIGHHTDQEALTGCTVILCPPGTVGGCDIRGSSPATRETALLAADKTMQEIHAVVLTGGSAFGLAVADGVMKFLEEHDIGYQTPWLKVPIVPAAAIFDLNIGDVRVRPGAAEGYKACDAAKENNELEGNVGAGTGATVGKWAGAEYRMKGGLGISKIVNEGLIVGCVAVVNAVGDVVDTAGKVLAGARKPDGEFLGSSQSGRQFARHKVLSNTNTTLVVLGTNAALTKVQVNRLSQRAHDGMARAIIPLHTSYDGDLVIALARHKDGPQASADLPRETGRVESRQSRTDPSGGSASGYVEENFDVVAEVAAEATARAVRSAVTKAKSAGGVPGVLG